MTALWTSVEIAEATGGTLTAEFDAGGLSIDTRSLKPGDLFIALTDQRDGHDFVAQAFAKGASAALVSRKLDDVSGPMCIVDDVFEALEALGRAGRTRSKAKVLAITGSAGKTSSKDMALTTLAKQGKTHGSFASFNNHWGVPLTLALMPRDTDYAVIEIGMNHPGEIGPLAKMAAPDVAMVTTVAPAHLAAFSGVEDIAREKAAIFQGIGSGGMAVVNADISVAGIVLAETRHATSCTFGTIETADWRAVDIHLHSDVTVVQAMTPRGDLLFKIAAPGRHLALNALGVLAAVDALGADPILAATDMAGWAPPAGRGAREIIHLDPVDEALTVQLIDDAYNANPASMAAGLEVLASSNPGSVRDRHSNKRGNVGRKIAVLGDMLELGSDELRLHASISQLPQLETLDVVHCVGPRMRSLWEALPNKQKGIAVDDVDAFLPKVRDLLEAGDVVMVKGSKGIQVSKVVDAIRKLGHPPLEDNRG